MKNEEKLWINEIMKYFLIITELLINLVILCREFFQLISPPSRKSVLKHSREWNWGKRKVFPLVRGNDDTTLLPSKRFSLLILFYDVHKDK